MKRAESQVFFNHLPGQMQRDGDNRVITIIPANRLGAVTSSNKQTDFDDRIFQRAEEKLKEFAELQPTETIDRKRFRISEIRGVSQSIFPTWFECGNPQCKAIISVSPKRIQDDATRARFLSWCKRCGSKVTMQKPLVLIHACGWIESPQPQQCRKHGYDHLILKRSKSGSQQVRDQAWYCKICDTKTGNFFDSFLHSCDFNKGWNDDDRQPAIPRPYQDPAVYQRVSFALINHPSNLWRTLRSDAAYRSLLLKIHLGLGSMSDLEQAATRPDIVDKEKWREEALDYLASIDVPRETAESEIQRMSPGAIKLQRFMQSRKCPFSLVELFSSSKPSAFGLADSTIADLALYEGLFDYYQLLAQAGGATTDWKAWCSMAPELEIPPSETETTSRLMAALGIEDASYTDRLPIAHVAIGFTRGLFGQRKKLNLFPAISAEERENPFYLHSLSTEAIVFRLKAENVVDWLRKRGHELPPVTKAYAARHILTDALKHTEVKAPATTGLTHDLTNDVYTLLHTFSHVLLKTANPHGGDDSSNMAEILVPSVPAVIIYLNKQSKFTSGAMQYMYQRNLGSWLKEARLQASICLNDPACLHATTPSTCYGCTQSGEIGCEGQNRFLDRRVLVQFPDNPKPGFWS